MSLSEVDLHLLLGVARCSFPAETVSYLCRWMLQWVCQADNSWRQKHIGLGSSSPCWSVGLSVFLDQASREMKAVKNNNISLTCTLIVMGLSDRLWQQKELILLPWPPRAHAPDVPHETYQKNTVVVTDPKLALFFWNVINKIISFWVDVILNKSIWDRCDVMEFLKCSDDLGEGAGQPCFVEI